MNGTKSKGRRKKKKVFPLLNHRELVNSLNSSQPPYTGGLRLRTGSPLSSYLM